MAILQDALKGTAQAVQPMSQQPAPAQASQAPQPGAQLPAPNPEVTSPIVLAHMDQLRQMQEMIKQKSGPAFDRVLVAGKKMLYSKELAPTVQQIVFDDKIPMENKLGEGVANLVVMMDNQGNGTIPKEVIIPVAVALLFEAADYLYEIGIDVSEETLGNAMEIMIYGVFAAYGMPSEQVDAIIDDMGSRLGFQEGGAEESAEPEEGAESATPTGEMPSEEDAAFQQSFTQSRGGM